PVSESPMDPFRSKASRARSFTRRTPVRASSARCAAGSALVALTVLGTVLPALPAPVSAQAPDRADRSQLPRVVVLATGGTIASRFDPEIGALRAADTGEEIVAAVPGLAEIARVTAEQVANVNSWDMTPGIWRQLERRANELLADPDVA